MAWVLIKRPENSVQVLSKESFQTLLLCDGETELSLAVLDAAMEEELKKYQAKDVIESCERPKPLEAEQYYRYYDNRYIRRVFWSVTGRCNFRCRHCYMDAPDAALGELTTEQALALIDQMADCGVLQVDITGGEPLVRKDLWQLIDHILSYKMTIKQIYTNGWLVNEHILDEFEKRGLKPEFAISFDGIGWHDWMRGVSGAEEAALRAIKLCRDRGFHVSIGMCIHRGNVHTLPQTVEVLHKLGVTEIATANVDRTSLWQAHSNGNEMTWPQYMEAMIPYIEWYYKAGRPIEGLELGGIAKLYHNQPGELRMRSYDGTENCLDCYLCAPTRWSCYITPEGRLLPCMPMTASPEQNKFPRVQDIGLKQGLSDSMYMQFVNGRIRDLFAANAECNGCKYRFKCGGGCRATALMCDHNLMGCDREMCTLWKNGYEERIMNAIEEAEKKYGAAIKS